MESIFIGLRYYQWSRDQELSWVQQGAAQGSELTCRNFQSRSQHKGHHQAHLALALSLSLSLSLCLSRSLSRSRSSSLSLLLSHSRRYLYTCRDTDINHIPQGLKLRRVIRVQRLRLPEKEVPESPKAKPDQGWMGHSFPSTCMNIAWAVVGWRSWRPMRAKGRGSGFA